MNYKINSEYVGIDFTINDANVFIKKYNISEILYEDSINAGIKMTRKDFKRFKTMIDTIDAEINYSNEIEIKTTNKTNRLDEVN